MLSRTSAICTGYSFSLRIPLQAVVSALWSSAVRWKLRLPEVSPIDLPVLRISRNGAVRDNGPLAPSGHCASRWIRVLLRAPWRPHTVPMGASRGAGAPTCPVLGGRWSLQPLQSAVSPTNFPKAPRLPTRAEILHRGRPLRGHYRRKSLQASHGPEGIRPIRLHADNGPPSNAVRRGQSCTSRLSTSPSPLWSPRAHRDARAPRQRRLSPPPFSGGPCAAVGTGGRSGERWRAQTLPLMAKDESRSPKGRQRRSHAAPSVWTRPHAVCWSIRMDLHRAHSGVTPIRHPTSPSRAM